MKYLGERIFLIPSLLYSIDKVLVFFHKILVFFLSGTYNFEQLDPYIFFHLLYCCSYVSPLEFRG